MSLSTPSGYTGSVMSYQPTQQTESPPFNQQENFVDIQCEGTPVIPTIEAKIDKGFFFSNDRVWTCYRRNYFAVTVSYGLTPWVPNGRLYLTRGGKGPEQIQSMAVSLAAAIDNSGGKAIELIQHTPKRDKGPQLQMKKELLSPTPPGKSHDHGSYSHFHQPAAVAGPQLPLQNETDSSHSYSPAGHSNPNYQQAFERIQFKYATANNGKRRAQQQYYHLIVELWANVQNPRDSQPDWVKVAARSSSHVVVRGRSPSHYSNEGPHNSSASRGGGSTGMGGPGLNSNGGPTYGGGYSRIGLNGPSALGGSCGSSYRGNTYSLDPSPIGSHSVSSASSMSGGPVEGMVDHHMVDEEESKPVQPPDGYHYYPHTIYETIPSKLESPGLPLPERRIKDEYSGGSTVGSGWSVGGCGRFQGVETSRGFYPDVHAHVGY